MHKVCGEKSDYLDKADEMAVEQITTFLNTVYPGLDVTVKVKGGMLE